MRALQNQKNISKKRVHELFSLKKNDFIKINGVKYTIKKSIYFCKKE